MVKTFLKTILTSLLVNVSEDQIFLETFQNLSENYFDNSEGLKRFFKFLYKKFCFYLPSFICNDKLHDSLMI